MALHGAANVMAAIEAEIELRNDLLRAAILQSLGNIAVGTPVDQSRAASNWFLKIGSPSNKTTNSTNGDPHLNTMPNLVLGKRIFYVNNMPYINKLEYGGYPGDGPKTTGGFSNLAIGGWVRTELLIMRQSIRNI